MPRRSHSADDLDKARQLRAQGWSLAAIADLYGIHRTTAYRWLGRGTGPTVVHGLNGQDYAGSLHRPPRPCVWCDRPNRTVRETCTVRCARERRRYREWLAGRLPKAGVKLGG
jgi:hypothetical protein